MPRLCPLCRGRKKAIWCYLWSIQNEGILLVTMHRKELRLVERNHATVKPDWNVASPGIKKFTAKAEFNCEIYKSWGKCWKNSVFVMEQPCALKRTETFASESMAMCLLFLWFFKIIKTSLLKRSDVLMFHSWHQSVCQQLFWH